MMNTRAPDGTKKEIYSTLATFSYKTWFCLQKQYQNFLTKHPDGRISRGSFHDMMKASIIDQILYAMIKIWNKTTKDGGSIIFLIFLYLFETTGYSRWNVFLLGMLSWDWHRKTWASHIQNVWYKWGDDLQIIRYIAINLYSGTDHVIA